MDAALEKEAGQLYALPPAEYTVARNARAKELRAEDAALAAAVAKLPKPTVAAAAVNRLAREQPSETRELIQAGKRLREAQEAAVAGKGKPDELQKALTEHRAALDQVQREARRLKLSDSVLERAVRTIRAASIDPELQRLLQRGLLAEELESAGFGVDPALVVPAKKPPGGARSDGQAEKRREARERLSEARQALSEAQKEARRAERELKRAEGAASLARDRLEEAEAELEQARESL
jgi:hypothetical protein